MAAAAHLIHVIRFLVPAPGLPSPQIPTAPPELDLSFFNLSPSPLHHSLSIKVAYLKRSVEESPSRLAHSRSSRLSDYNIYFPDPLANPTSAFFDFNNFDLNIHSTSIKCFERRRCRRPPKWLRHSISPFVVELFTCDVSRCLCKAIDGDELRKRIPKPSCFIIFPIDPGTEKSNDDDDTPFGRSWLLLRRHQHVLSLPLLGLNLKSEVARSSWVMGGLSDKQILASGVELFFTSWWNKSKLLGVSGSSTAPPPHT